MQQRNLQFRQAAADGNLKTVTDLVKDVEINEAGKESKQTALHRAASNGHGPVVTLLLKAKAAVDCKDKDGNTPLNAVIQSEAKVSRRIPIMQELMQAGADPLVPNNLGRTPFMNLHLVRDHKDVVNNPHTQAELAKVIQQIKRHVLIVASQKGLSARIRPSGEVIFDDVEKLIKNHMPSDVPQSGSVKVFRI